MAENTEIVKKMKAIDTPPSWARTFREAGKGLWFIPFSY
jgi:hypothetical protein